jgi:hypothetical protein
MSCCPPPATANFATEGSPATHIPTRMQQVDVDKPHGRDWLPDSTLGQAPEIQAHLFGCVFLPPGLALPMQTLAAILALPMRPNRPFLRMQAGGVQRGDAGASAGDGAKAVVTSLLPAVTAVIYRHLLPLPPRALLCCRRR